MKKFLALLLTVCMLAAMLVACAPNKPAENNGSGASATPAPANTQAPDPADPSVTGDDVANGGATGTFKIGGIGPLTGGAAIYGNAAMNGAQIAVDEINAMGGALSLEFRAEDDVHDAETAVNAYNTLMDWGMQLMVGTVTTAPCIAVSAEAYNDRLFMLTPSASSTDVIADKDNMFQVCFTDPNQGVGSADYMAANMAGKKVAVIYRNDDAYSQGIRDTFASEAAAKGVEIVYEGTFTEATQTNFSVQLSGAQSAGAEVVFLPMYYQPASVILTQASQMGYAPIFFGVDGMDGILTMEGFDASLAEGVMLLTPFSADAKDARTQNFVKKYTELYGETPNQFAADGYDAVYILCAALNAAGCDAGMGADEICEAVISVMPTIKVDGVTGQGMTWTASGEVSKAPMAVVIADGKYVLPQ